MSFQLDLEPVTLQPKNSQIVLLHQIDDGFDIVELQNDILLVVGGIPPSSLLPGLGRDRVPPSLRYRATSLCIGPKIAQAGLQFWRISSHCLNTAANLD
jgi:hypothetical protein